MKENDRIIVVSFESAVFSSKYNNYTDLKAALEEALNKPDKIFRIEGISSFMVSETEEGILGGEQALIVTVSGIAYGEVRTLRYVFHNQNLLNISDFDVSLNQGRGRNKEIDQILSTLRF